ncbi:hypothetical protein [Anaerococcus nagyae]|uniref:hypothetical protein n=1 Tax=Anaerococcus nagyae TaxID=1755241 RepID=UPI00324A999E
MKTKEFKRKVEELGFDTNIVQNDIYVEMGYYSFVIARISMVTRYEMDIAYESCYEIDDDIKGKLFQLVVAYTSTPIDERGEEKKFYLKHRWIKGCVIMYLYRNELNGYCYLGDKKCRPHRQKRFTLKEIEEIKEKYDTKLEDFEIVEVEE